MQSYDYYGTAATVCELLRRNSHSDWAQRIEDIIAGGSTGTEILMGVRWQLQEYMRENPGQSGELKAKICELLDELDKTLS